MINTKSSTMPIFKVADADSIDYRHICKKVSVGESFIIQYPDNFIEVCERIDELQIFIPANNGCADGTVDLNADYKVQSIASY